jgi:large subunit ribosomal protein L15
MQTHTVKRNVPEKSHVQLGRGGRHGKTSGRGGKGQTARAGNKRRPQMRDEIKKIPKLRGYKFASIQKDFYPINLTALENAFNAGETVTLEALREKKVVRVKGGNNPRVKILATGSLTKKLSIKGCTYSEAAKAAIEKVGGTIEA